MNDAVNSMDLGATLSIVGVTVGAISSVVTFLRSYRAKRAERRFIAALNEYISQNPKEPREVILEFEKLLNELRTKVVGMGGNEVQMKNAMAELTKLETKELLSDLESVSKTLPSDEHKVILEGLAQPSDKGKVAYAAKILSRLEAMPPTSGAGAPQQDSGA